MAPPLTSYSTLGRSGLVVSPLSLGTMTFGTPGWGTDEPTAGAILDAYLDAGGNVIDTADVYAGGAGEEMVGRLLAERGLRDEVVLATKFGFNASSSPLDASRGGRRRPSGGGNGATHVRAALESSLRRLGTDHVDLYWMHIWDGVTPAHELVQSLGDLVRAGKIRYYAFSDMPAWFAMQAATIAAERGVPGPIAMQVEYSLVARAVEEEHAAVARAAGMGIVPWSPLAGGLLAGKYTRGQEHDAGRLSGANPFGDTKFTEGNWDVVDVVREVADELGSSPAQVALAWVMGRPGVTSTLVGATSVAQVQSNLAAGELAMEPDQRRRLDDVGAPVPGVAASLTSPAIRRMLFGGHDVRAWPA